MNSTTDVLVERLRLVYGAVELDREIEPVIEQSLSNSLSSRGPTYNFCLIYRGLSVLKNTGTEMSRIITMHQRGAVPSCTKVKTISR